MKLTENTKHCWGNTPCWSTHSRRQQVSKAATGIIPVSAICFPGKGRALSRLPETLQPSCNLTVFSLLVTSCWTVCNTWWFLMLKAHLSDKDSSKSKLTETQIWQQKLMSFKYHLFHCFKSARSLVPPCFQTQYSWHSLRLYLTLSTMFSKEEKYFLTYKTMYFKIYIHAYAHAHTSSLQWIFLVYVRKILPWKYYFWKALLVCQ